MSNPTIYRHHEFGLPRWVNLDDKIIMDTVTLNTVYLTCEDNDRTQREHAMEVTDALNRIYPL